jgi:heat shock protein HtpX
VLYDRIERNRRATVLLFAGFAVVVLALSVALDALFVGGGPAFAGVLSGIIMVGAVLFAWFAADRVVLSAMGAREPNLSVREERLAVDVIEELSIGAGIPQPKVYIVDDPAPNAFATGRSPDKGVVGFTSGLLRTMNRHELEAVAAHEVSHITNRDSMVGVVAAVLVGLVLVVSRVAFRMLLYGGGRGGRRSGGGRGGGGQGQIIILALALVFLVLAPIFAMLLRFAVSRRRESLADVSAVRLTHNPEAMISALEKLDADHQQVRVGSGMAAHLWIEEPVGDARSSRESWLDRVLRTHPPIPERIKALRGVAGELGYR